MGVVVLAAEGDEVGVGEGLGGLGSGEGVDEL